MRYSLLIYSDPADDGFAQGDVYPSGPMRNPDGVQRGSLFNGDGDPATPTWSSGSSCKSEVIPSTPPPCQIAR